MREPVTIARGGGERRCGCRWATRTTAVIAAVSVAVLLAGCQPAAPRDQAATSSSSGSRGEAPVGGTTRTLDAPRDLGLRAVPLPDLSSTDASVLAQFEARRRHVEVALQQPAAKPALAQAYGELGQLLHAATEFDGAEASYRNAHQLNPNDPRWPYYLGHVFRIKGPLTEAVQWFERARARLPDDLATTVWLADLYLALGQPDTADSLFANALGLSDGSAAAHFGVGRVALARRDYPAAVQHLERVRQLDPRATAVHYPLAMAYRGRGDLAKAEAELAIKGDVEPRPVDPLMQSVDALLESAEAYNIRGGAELAAGRWTAAADQFRRGLDIRPTDPSLRHRLGTALAQMGDAVGAAAAFEQVIRTHPEFARAYFSLGVLAADRREYEPAIERFRAALTHEPGYVQARVQLAWALARGGKPGESLTHFDQALALEPTQSDAAFGAALALVRLGRYREAHDRLVAASTLYPDHPAINHALARILAAAPDASVRDGRRAKVLVDRLLAAQGQTLDLGEATAMMLAEIGQFEQAVDVQKTVIEGAERLNLHAVVARLTTNLRRYERREPCRVPFTADEL